MADLVDPFECLDALDPVLGSSCRAFGIAHEDDGEVDPKAKLIEVADLRTRLPFVAARLEAAVVAGGITTAPIALPASALPASVLTTESAVV